jgi:Rieske Fe-S protein
MSTDTETEAVVRLEQGRRDFLILVAGAVGGVAAVSALWPLIDSLNPSKDVVAAGAPVDFDLARGAEDCRVAGTTGLCAAANR